MVSPLTTHPDRMQCYNPEPGSEDVMSIAVFRDGQVYFRSTRVADKDLVDLITAVVEEAAEKKIYLAADGRARNSDVELVLDQVRVAGITRVAILTY